ncbi:MAG: NAD(P)H-hydrate dehydratase [Pseudooceanicola sp.]
MSELLTAAQMRAVEQAAIDSGEVTGLELMERAGRGVVEAVFEEWPELAASSHRAVVLCGPGNNGGDGFVVARLLKEWGWEVEVFLYGDPDKLPPDARVNYDRWCGIGVVVSLSDDNLVDGLNTLYAWVFDKSPELIVDAFFGTGLTRAVPHVVADIQQDVFGRLYADGRYARVVAVDAPSGACADSGRWIGVDAPHPEDVLSDLTVSFHSEKLGHRLADGPLYCGKVVVKDIGLDEATGTRSGPVLPRPTPGPGANLSDSVVRLVEPSHDVDKFASNHKYSHGHALILTGGAGRTGAARLAARGALRIGAGLVTLGVQGAAQMEVASQITALMLKRVDDAGGLAEMLEDKRINALCLGPGMGVERAAEMIPPALRAKHAPRVVLDADALTAIAGDPALFGMLNDRCVLTPHGGEFARLFPDIAEKLSETPTRGPAYSKVDATREAAVRAGCTILYKGPDTVIAAPDGRAAINSAHYDRAAPWLATAGAGDVLSGFIAGLLARGLGAMRAAEMAAWLHVECARTFGPGLVAEDLPEMLPRVFRDLGM